jgi:hypothetical protein
MLRIVRGSDITWFILAGFIGYALGELIFTRSFDFFEFLSYCWGMTVGVIGFYFLCGTKIEDIIDK